jgi:hypothetical protein
MAIATAELLTFGHQMISEKRTDFYTLYKDPNGQWIIDVLCGGIAVYLRRLKLNPEKIGMIEE